MSTFRWTGADLINLSQTKELLERWGLALTLNLYINCYYGKDYKSTWACVTTIMWGGGGGGGGGCLPTFAARLWTKWNSILLLKVVISMCLSSFLLYN